MDKQFENYLRDLREPAKAKKRLEDDEATGNNVYPLRIERLRKAVSKVREKYLPIYHQRSAEQDYIFELQAKKQRVMEKLDQDLVALDNDPDDIEWSGLPVYEEGGELTVAGSADSTPQQVTVGELLASLHWNFHFDLADPSIPRRVKKQYLVADATNELHKLLDQQIISHKLSQSDDIVRPSKKAAYQNALDRIKRQKAGEESEPNGIVAEKMATSLLMKWIIDDGLDIELMDIDVFDDVENKADIRVRRVNRVRDITVDIHESLNAYDIQITINDDPKIIALKHKQLEQLLQSHPDFVVETVLVELGGEVASDIQLAFAKWRHQPTPGGPDKLLPEKTKEKLFRALLQHLFTEEELNERWALIGQ